MTVMWRTLLAALLLAVALGAAALLSAAPPSDGGSQAGLEGSITSAAGETPPAGVINGTIRIDNFGWRPGDRKIAVIRGRAQVAVEVRRRDDQQAIWSGASGALQTDEDSGDTYSTIDFSDVRQPGTFFLVLPADNQRSYDFAIDDRVYDVVGAAAVKSYYFQRCNHTRQLPFASDALPGYPGRGGRWTDDLCHPDDFAAPAGPGSPDHGKLDLHGGWHDAGDYQKTLWDRGVDAMLWAYELHPRAWWDGQLALPESGNGVADLLDEAVWELDFYLRMQRPDGHFMTSVKGKASRMSSPPSKSDERRVYFDTTSPEGNGWSGGGVTIAEATANAVLALAHAAIVFQEAGEADRAARYRSAALAGFAWLTSAGASTIDGASRAGRESLAAAAAVYRLDRGNTAARDLVERTDWSTWNGTLPGATPGEHVFPQAAWHCLANPALDSRLRGVIRQSLSVLVEKIFAQAGAYGGLYGGPDNGWDWSWGSNKTQNVYGVNLLMAAHFGALGGRRLEEVEARAQSYFHYLLGLNPLSMVYLTNMAAYGGEHSSFQIYHNWFSSGAGGTRGSTDYNGKPATLDEPLYPYNPDDRQISMYGPAPGLMPGGPNWYYTGAYQIPNRRYPAYAYRDWSIGCDWDGTRCTSAAWEVTEPAVGYQGWFLLLASFYMSQQS